MSDITNADHMFDDSHISLSAFEQIKHVDVRENEFWYARQLQELLDYLKWQDFLNVILSARELYIASGAQGADNLFRQTRTQSLKAKRTYLQVDYELTRHACYLIVLEADGSKPSVALGKRYFAYTTEQFQKLQQTEEDRLRIELRDKLKRHHLELSARARVAGVSTTQQFARFFNAGHRGLYRETASQIAVRKGLKSGQDVYDFMGSLETSANDFRATFALALLNQRSIMNVPTANEVHYEAADAVRQTMVGKGIYPERLVTPMKSYIQLVREQKQRQQLEALYSQDLWSLLEQGSSDQTQEAKLEATSQLETVELGIKITVESVASGTDRQFTLEYTETPVSEAEYSSLSFTQPISTLLHLYWVPSMPDERVAAEAMAALDAYLVTLIQQNTRLNALYGGKSPLQS